MKQLSFCTSTSLLQMLRFDANIRQESVSRFLNKILPRVIKTIEPVRREEQATIYLNPFTKSMVDKASQDLGIPKSEVIHLCLEEYYKGFPSGEKAA